MRGWGQSLDRLLDEVRRTQPHDKTARGVGSVMAWILLVISGVLEAVWATALGRSAGFSKPVPTVVFAVGLVLSMTGLALALRSLPVGTGYAVWVGIGAATTVAYAVATGAEPFGWVKLLLVLGIIACVVGLKLVH